MATPAPSKRAAVTAIPARYAKFLAALIGEFVLYTQLYGFVWHPVPAITAMAAALGVYGVPNAPKPPVLP